ncbi:MAG: hypothetical protein SRB2_03704 [Desulfobacteraceae bacterium Eth-SRB2]|nr:MAG: hypothetical protein SRB2_03704 [Desulfobacteraceae bacterium Eth-SRB2]
MNYREKCARKLANFLFPFRLDENPKMNYIDVVFHDIILMY